MCAMKGTPAAAQAGRIRRGCSHLGFDEFPSEAIISEVRQL
jgi:hypothetical protein